MHFSNTISYAPINDIQDPVLHLASPFSGKVFSLNDHPQALFSSGMLGRGVCVELSQGKITAPFDGQIEQIKRQGYEIILIANNGLKLLINIFSPNERTNLNHQITRVLSKDKIKQGELIAYFETTHLETPLIGSLIIVNAERLGPCYFPLRQVRTGLDPLITITQNQHI